MLDVLIIATFVLGAFAASDTKAADTTIHTRYNSGVNFLGSRAPTNASTAEPSTVADTAESLQLTANEMEQAVANLMLGKSGFGATPMGSSVQKIINLVKHTMEPKVLAASVSDEKMLKSLASQIDKCQSERQSSLTVANRLLAKYKKESRLHKTCRVREASLYTSKKNCVNDQKSLHTVKHMKCKAFATVSNQWGHTKHNSEIVKKGGGEIVESYITRLSTTFCGKHVHGRKGKTPRPGGWGGGLADGMLDQYLRAKDACSKATKAWQAKVKQCKRAISLYSKTKGSCNKYQMFLDSASCKRAVISKDACESFAGCYFNKEASYKVSEAKVRFNVMDRKAEWRGLKRIGCLIDAFADGKVTGEEIEVCKNKTYSTDLLNLDYPKLPALKKCVVPNLYPTTELYKKREFAPLPAVAKGKDSFECSGMEEISLTPNEGSPSSCKCERVTMNGPYSAGPLVKCTNCLDVRKSTQRNSCPVGTKIFSPASERDWKTLFKSAGPLKAPNWIVDITRPQQGCQGCTRSPMRSTQASQDTYRTSDGSPWWLRSTKYSQPSGNYHANCYLSVWGANENNIMFDDDRCKYHANSYYCQKEKLNLKPRAGSPTTCRCTRVILTGRYSAGPLVKCENCLDVRKVTQKNSCPNGMKIFSPRTRSDWKTFLKSAGPLKAPNWIIDITRPQQGCHGCTRSPMRSTQASQATWRTSDGSPWWLRSTKYSEPSGNYNANCYLGLRVANDVDSITFDDAGCNNHANSYYCQPEVKLSAKKEVIATVKRDPPVMVATSSSLKIGFLEKQYYFTQNGKCDIGNRQPDVVRAVNNLHYEDGGGGWHGFSAKYQFAARWEGILIIRDGGKYKLQIESDDGSMLYIDDKLIVNNDGYHGKRKRSAVLDMKPLQHKVLIKYFQASGWAGMDFSYHGPDTGNKMKIVPQSAIKHEKPNGFKEEVFYTGEHNTAMEAFSGTPTQVKLVMDVAYGCTHRAWAGFLKKDTFSVRYTAVLKVTQGGNYRFQTRSDDGSVLFVGGKKVVDNDRPHSYRSKYGDTTLNSNSETELKLLYFQNYGASCVYLLYMGADTNNKLRVIDSSVVHAPF